MNADCEDSEKNFCCADKTRCAQTDFERCEDNNDCPKEGLPKKNSYCWLAREG